MSRLWSRFYSQEYQLVQYATGRYSTLDLFERVELVEPRARCIHCSVSPLSNDSAGDIAFTLQSLFALEFLDGL
jgi:hypothetical protein